MKYKYVADNSKYNAFVFDLDGTLADMGKRTPYNFQDVYNDTVIGNVHKLLLILEANNDIVILTGRNEICREDTIKWLNHHGIPFTKLIMRPMGDQRKDAIIKMELFRDLIAPYHNILGVFDDRDVCVKMWREIGATCYQPAYGAF